MSTSTGRPASPSMDQLFSNFERDETSVDKLQRKLASVRQKIRIWKNGFVNVHGRSVEHSDIAQVPHVKAWYKKYTKTKDDLERLCGSDVDPWEEKRRHAETARKQPTSKKSSSARDTSSDQANHVSSQAPEEQMHQRQRVGANEMSDSVSGMGQHCDSQTQSQHYQQNSQSSPVRHARRGPDGQFQQSRKAGKAPLRPDQPSPAPDFGEPVPETSTPSSAEKRRDRKGRFIPASSQGSSTPRKRRRGAQDDDDDEEYTPRKRRTMVHATPQKNGRVQGLLESVDDMTPEELERIMQGNREEAANRRGARGSQDAETANSRTCGGIQLRPEDKVTRPVIADPGGAQAEGQPSTVSGSVKVCVPSPEGRYQEAPIDLDGIGATLATPSKGKERTRSEAPEQTTSNVHRPGRTPPSTGRHRLMQHMMASPTSLAFLPEVKRKRSDSIESVVAISHDIRGMATPSSKASSSGKPRSRDEFDTPAFLRQGSRVPLRLDELSHLDSPMRDDALADAPDATPSKRQRSKSVGANAARRPASAIPPRSLPKISSLGPLRKPLIRSKSLAQISKERQQQNGYLDQLAEERRAAKEKEDEAWEAHERSKQIFDPEMDEIFRDLSQPDETTDPLQGSSSNPYQRKKKAPKRQTRKHNLKAKPAVQHERAFDPASASTRPSTCIPRATPSQPVDDVDGLSELHDSGYSSDVTRARGEPERKRWRSLAPTVDSCAHARDSIEDLSPFKAATPAFASPSRTQDRSRAETEPPSPIMVNKTNKMVSTGMQTNGTAKRTGAFAKPKVPGAHHLAGNFVRNSGLDRKQKREQKGKRDRSWRTRVK